MAIDWGPIVSAAIPTAILGATNIIQIISTNQRENRQDKAQERREKESRISESKEARKNQIIESYRAVYNGLDNVRQVIMESDMTGTIDMAMHEIVTAKETAGIFLDETTEEMMEGLRGLVTEYYRNRRTAENISAAIQEIKESVLSIQAQCKKMVKDFLAQTTES